MIDYLVITVVFLLSQFGRSSRCSRAPTWRSPRPPRGQPPLGAHRVDLRPGVLLDGQRIATPGEVRASNDRIDRLFERLEQARREYPVLHPEPELRGRHRLPDRPPVDWQVIKTVARTCAAAGFVRLNFAVTKGNASTPTS
jgi:hypothetical protein